MLESWLSPHGPAVCIGGHGPSRTGRNGVLRSSAVLGEFHRLATTCMLEYVSVVLNHNIPRMAGDISIIVPLYCMVWL